MKRFNLDQFIWFVVLLSLSVVLSLLVFTGDIYLIIDSDRKLSTMFMLIMFYVLTFVQFTRVQTIPSRQGVKGGYFQFIFLVLILAFISTINITKVSLDAKGVKLYHHSHSNTEHHNHEHVDLEVAGNIIEISYDNFHSSVEELFAHRDKYVGKAIDIEGVYYDTGNLDNFIITMLDMNCCIADSEYVGIYCEVGENVINKFQSGDKIRLKGTIENFEEDNKELLKIIVTAIE